MKAYSKDLREHVLRAVDQGHPRAEIVRMFGVSLATIKRYLKQRRETGDLSPKAIPGRPSKKYAALEAGLIAQLQAYPDSTLQAHCQHSTWSLWMSAAPILHSRPSMHEPRKGNEPQVGCRVIGGREYDADRLALARGHGSGHDPGGIGQWCRF